MTQPAAFTGHYADWKVIKTRSCIQIVIEVPVENEGQAYSVLGGMPKPGESLWLAVARLQPDKGGGEHPQPILNPYLSPQQENEARAREKRRFNDLPLPQQAALLCQDPVFWAFLSEREDIFPTTSVETAAVFVRNYCGVTSRSQLQPRTRSGSCFESLRDKFHAWKLTQ